MTSLSLQPIKALRLSLSYLVLIAGSLLLMFPLIWTFSTSLKAYERVTFASLELIPNPVVWQNYITIFQKYPIATYIFNTLKIVGAALVGGAFTCSLAGFALSRIRFPGRDALFLIVLSTMMLPYVARMIPLYVMWDRAGLVNTYWPLVLPRLLGHDAFFIFLYRQFFRGIPEDYFDAARVDGASEFGIWARIVLPLSKPVLATIAIFAFQNGWNEFLNALIYVGAKKALWTLSLGLNTMRVFEGPIHWELIMAYTMVMIIPMLVIFALGQKNIIQGASMSGLKG